jgi:nicotinic acid phosphoribosyltransferase
LTSLNPLIDTDSYKLSHFLMYPEGLEYVESNFTPRKSRVEGINHVVQFGLQAWLKERTKAWDAFFAAPKEEVIREYMDNISSFVAPGFPLSHVEALHDLGYLPLQFSALPEGTPGPIGVPSILIKSTHKDFAWLVNYVESDLSAGVWHLQTVATLAWSLRRVFEKAARDTGVDSGTGALDGSSPVDWQLHDFSYRGQVNREAAASSGAAHLLSFLGSDAVPSIPWINRNYPGNNGLLAASVPATEHSVMCAYGRANEIGAFKHQLATFPKGILSIVSDTYSLRQVIEDFLPKLKEEILGRDGKVVIRPDSGDPADIICGTERALGKGKDFYEKGAIEALWDLFGGTVNDAGYKVLNPVIGLIYGDGMYKDRIEDINARLKAKGFASINWVAGIGSYSYQMVTRDTFGSAVKATFVIVNGEERNIQKDPETDDGTKKSATGRLAVGYMADGTLFRIEEATDEQIARSMIQPVWENGKFLKEYAYFEVRANLRRWTGILERNGGIS